MSVIPTISADGVGVVSAGQLNAYQISALNTATLRGLAGQTGMTAFLQGVTVPNDGGQGAFYWNYASTAPDDNLNVIVPYGNIYGAWIRLTQSGSAAGVSSVSFGGTGLTPATTTTGAVSVGGVLNVTNGGTGTTTPTLVAGTNVTITGSWPNQTINSTGGGSSSGTVNSGGSNQLAYYGATGTAVSGAANGTILGGALSLGTAGSSAGSLLMSGATSGTVTLKTAAAAGTWALTLPTAVPSVTGYVLSSDTSGVTSWVANGTGGGGVTTISFGTTGLTPSTASSGVVTVAGTLAVANGGTGVTTSTGTGANVLSTSPTFVTPILGTPTSVTLTNATGLPISTGVSGLGSNVATALGVAVGTSGAFVTNGGALGTPSSGTLTNATNLPISTGVSGLGTNVATALALAVGQSGAIVTNVASVNTQTSTSPTLSYVNNNQTVELANGSSNVSVYLPVLSTAVKVDIVQLGTGTVQLVASGGATVNSRIGATIYLSAQYSGCTVYNNSNGTLGSWIVVGDVAPST